MDSGHAQTLEEVADVRVRPLGDVAKAVVVQITTLLLLAAATSKIAVYWQQHDFHLYWTTCENLRRGMWPYIAFPFEYPPLAAVIFTIPRWLGIFWLHDEGSYVAAYTLQAAVLAAMATPVIAALARKSGIDLPPLLRRYTLILLIMFPMVLSRYDVVPALATALAIFCLLDDRPWSAGSLLGFAIAAKLYPLVLIGLFVGHGVARRRFRDSAKIIAAATFIAVLPLIPYLLRGSTDFLSFLRYHEQRGLQLESVPAGLILLAAKLHLTKVTIAYDFGAYHIHSPASANVLPGLPWIMAGAWLLMTLLGYHRLRRDVMRTGHVTPNTVIETCVALLLIFMATNKVFSPQYLVWILPLAPLLPGQSFRIVLIAIVLTSIQYPLLYHRLRVDDLDGVILLNLRNATVLAAIIAMAIGCRANATAIGGRSQLYLTRRTGSPI
jgi:Glycosyltransferase family 87